MTHAKESIIEKIRKLLALAGNNPSAEERARADEAAKKLMEQHDIDEAAVHGGGSQVGNFITKINCEDHWVGWVMRGVGELYNVKPYRHHDGAIYRAAFIGTVMNCEVAADITQWLIKNIAQEARDTFEYKPDQKDFCEGAANVYRQRATDYVKEQKRLAAMQNTPEATRANQLMVISTSLQKANDDWARTNLKLGKSRSVRYTETAGTRAGKVYGGQLSLNKQLTQSNDVKRIGKK